MYFISHPDKLTFFPFDSIMKEKISDQGNQTQVVSF